jgi:hypothetical protein
MRRDGAEKTGMIHEFQTRPRFRSVDFRQGGTTFAGRRDPVFKGRLAMAVGIG